MHKIKKVIVKQYKYCVINNVNNVDNVVNNKYFLLTLNLL